MILTMFGATDAQLAELGARDSLDPSVLGLTHTDLGDAGAVALATLDAILTGAPYDQVVDRVLQPVVVVNQGEEVLFVARPELADALRSADEVALMTAATAWSATEELTEDHWTAQACAGALYDLRELIAGLPEATKLYTWCHG